MSTVEYGKLPAPLVKPTPQPFVADPIPQAAKAAPVAPVTVFCRDCVFAQKADLPPILQARDEYGRWLCQAEVESRHPVSGLPVDGKPVLCSIMRRPAKPLADADGPAHEAGRCGPGGSLYKRA